jgi:hypothetical protein
MKDNVFQCHGETKEKHQFQKTVGVLEEHINKTFLYPQDIAMVCKTLAIPELVQPDNISKDDYLNDMGKKMMWEVSMKSFMKRRELLESNRRGVYAIVWGQCSPMMQSKVESLNGFIDKSYACDCVWLLAEIRGITHKFEGTRNVFISLDDAWTSYYGYSQGHLQTVHDYLKEFQGLVQVLDHYGAAIGADGPYQEEVMEKVKESNPNLSDAEYTVKAIEAAKRKQIAIAFLKRAETKRYGGLWSELENLYTRGQDHYPEDLTSAYNLLVNYKPAPATNQPRRERTTSNRPEEDVSGMSFLQDGAAVAGTDGVVHELIKCYNCNTQGHYASSCPTEVQEGHQMLQLSTAEDTADEAYESAFSFAQATHSAIPDSWILLDSQSTVSVFKNKALVTNIRPSARTLRVHTNGGTQTSNQIGTVKNFGDVWFNTNSLANILSMAEVRKVCRITMDTSLEAAMHVHRKDGSLMKFQEYRSGLYFFDTLVKKNTSTNEQDYLFLNTVAGNKGKYTQHEIQGADKARALYKKIGRPSEQAFSDILKNNLIRNCPVTPDDARRALEIYGPDIATLKGKTVKKQNKGIPNYQAVLIPAPIIEQYNDVRLFIDIFWVNGHAYFHTISEWIKFRTVAPINNRSTRTLLMETKAVIRLYETRGFIVTRVEGDHEFACITNELLPIPLNIADADDHVAQVERSIRTIKERTRCLIQGLPFKRVPKVMMRAAVENANKVLNQFPPKGGVSETLSPLTIMTGKPTPDYNDMKIEFGAYAQVFEDNDPTNTQRARTTGAIALTPTGNAQGGYNFMSLTTGRKLSRQQWDELPMPDGVIDKVERMGELQLQPIMGDGAPLFEWTPGVAIEEDFAPPILLDGAESDDGHNPEETGDEEEDASSTDDDFDPDSDPEEDEESHVPEDTEEENSDDERGDNAEELRSADSDEEEQEYEHDAQELTEDEASEEEVPEEETTDGPNLRPNRGRNYEHRFGHAMDNPASNQSYETQFLQHCETNAPDSYQPTLREAVEDMQSTGSNDKVQKYVTGFVMMQMTAKAGIKKHGQVAVDALFDEFLQLHDLGVFQALDPTKLPRAQKKGALRAINVIKEKRCGKIKGRTVADGSAQRHLYTKEETSSPTVSTDALMLSLMIDAAEERDVATADVAGAYLHADMEDFTILRMEGESVDIMCDVNEGYRKYVCYENGKKALYLQLLKALYGCVKSALLWYHLFSSTLQQEGFVLNPYDTCVANKDIDGSQCTVLWYVDDNKISHVDDKVVTRVIKKIESKFGKMTVTRGSKHTFLGMKIRFNKNKKLDIKMREYIEEAIDDFGENISRTATTPAKKDLFEIDEEIDNESADLTNEKRETFHSVVAKLLYVSKRCRLDIQLPIAFLCTRVSCSTEQDWAKLKRVLEYLKGSLDEFLTLGADDITRMMTWVDASYAVHRDMKSHTGGLVSFGTGAVMSKSSKQKLNTKSSTESELVGASDYLPQPIWGKKFLEAQGYTLKENVFHQDNKSTIRFEKNGRKSCGPNSRHIDIRYFFIKDRIDIEGIEVKHCPTEQMLADFFTKPLQGSLFRKFREVIMGHKHVDSLKEIVPTASQERVEKDSLPEHSRNAVDGRKADVGTPKPHIVTWADIARKKTLSKSLALRPSTLKVRGKE